MKDENGEKSLEKSKKVLEEKRKKALGKICKRLTQLQQLIRTSFQSNQKHCRKTPYSLKYNYSLGEIKRTSLKTNQSYSIDFNDKSGGTLENQNLISFS